jgi:hypothetical protein
MANFLESRTTYFRPPFHLDMCSRKGELTIKFSEQQHNWRPRTTTEPGVRCRKTWYGRTSEGAARSRCGAPKNYCTKTLAHKSKAESSHIDSSSRERHLHIPTHLSLYTVHLLRGPPKKKIVIFFHMHLCPNSLRRCDTPASDGPVTVCKALVDCCNTIVL